MGRYRGLGWLMLAITALVTKTSAAPIINVPADQPTIQAAVTAANAGDTIIVAANVYTEQITINEAGHSRNGISLLGAGVTLNGGFYLGATSNVRIEGFHITGGYQTGGHKAGIALIPGAGAIVKNNEIDNCLGGNSWGIEVGYNANNLQILDNNIHHNNGGIYLNPSSGHTISGNQIHDNSGNGVGIGSDGLSNTTLIGNTFTNQVEGWGASAVGANVAAYQNNFVNCADGINQYGGQAINAELNWWGSADEADVAAAHNGAVNAVPWLDGPAPGGNPVAPPIHNVTLNTYHSQLQAAINAATAGNTILVGPGTYNQSPNINKSLVLQSTAGAAATIINLQPGQNYLSALTVTGSGVNATIDGFTINGFDAVGTGLASSNIVVTGLVGDVAVRNCQIRVGKRGPGTNGDDGFGAMTYYAPTTPGNSLLFENCDFQPLTDEAQRAFMINPGINTFTFRNNTISGTFKSSSLTQAKNSLIELNSLTGTGVAGSRSGGFSAWSYPNSAIWGHVTLQKNVIQGVSFAFGAFASNQVVIQNNVITNCGAVLSANSYGDATFDPKTVVLRHNSLGPCDGKAIVSTEATPVDASLNWWGSADPATVAAAADTKADFTPWLGSGVDADAGAAGFQGSLDALHVAAASPQTGATGRIQEALNQVASGGTIDVGPGSYPDPGMLLNKPVTLRGAKAGIHPAVGMHPTEVVGARGTAETILTQPGVSVFSPAADDLTIDGFTLTGNGRIIDTYANANRLHITNCIFSGTADHSTTGKIQLGGGSHTDLLLDYNLLQDGGEHLLYTGGGPFDRMRIAYNKLQAAGDAVFWAATPLVDGVIEANEFDGGGTGFNTVNIGQAGNLQIRDNWIHDVSYTAFQVGVIGGAVSGNRFERIVPYSTYGGDGLQFWGGEWGTGVSANVTVARNTFVFNDLAGPSSTRGIRFRTGANAGTITLSLNRFANGRVAPNAVALLHQGTGTLDARNNWWSSNTPVADGLFGGTGTLNVTPWLVLGVTAAPATQTLTAHASAGMDFTASLVTNSLGQDTSGLGSLPSGIPVAYTTSTNGTMAASGPELVNGQGTARLTGSTTSGTAVGTVTVDGQAVSAGELTGTSSLAAVDAALSTVTLSPTSATVGAPAVLLVALKDAAGNPIVGSPVGARALAVHALVVDRSATSTAGATGAVGDTGLSISDLGAVSDGSGQFQVTVAGQYVDNYALQVKVGEVLLTASNTLAVTGSLTKTFPAGVNWIGLPVTADNPAVTAVYPTATLVQQYNGSALATYAGNVAVGQGLWVTFPAATTVTVAGVPTPNAPVRIALPAGQSQLDLANPFGENWTWEPAKINVYSGGVLLGRLSDVGGSGTVQKYIGRQVLVRGRKVILPQTSAALNVCEGFRVYTNGAAYELELLYTGSNPRAEVAAAASLSEWQVNLLAEQAGTVSEVVLGVSASRAAQYVTTLQPEPSAVELQVIATGGGRLMGEVVAGGATRSWDLEAVSQVAGEVVLSWPSLQRSLPRGLVATLEDLSTGQVTLLNTRAAYRYQSQGGGERRALRLSTRVGNIERATITSLSLQATRGGGAQLQLTVSGAADLTLTVRGLGGRLVKQVRSQAGGAGTVTVSWDGTDADGRPVPRGTYQVEAVAVSANGAASRAVRTVAID